MPKPAIKRGSDYFFTALYEGNGQGQKVVYSITLVNLNYQELHHQEVIEKHLQ